MNIELIIRGQVGDVKQQIWKKGFSFVRTNDRQRLDELLDILRGHSNEASRIRNEIVDLLQMIEIEVDLMDQEAVRLKDWKWTTLFKSTESTLDLAELDARITKAINMMERSVREQSMDDITSNPKDLAMIPLRPRKETKSVRGVVLKPSRYRLG